jgi:hypothetical protein
MTLSKVFWSDDADWVVEASREEYGEKTLYGGFFNPDVALAWAGDMGFASYKVRRLQPPPDPRGK